MPDDSPQVPRWSIGDLRRPLTLVSIVAVFLASLAVTTLASCNVHELGHALVGTAVGWEVEEVSPCPGGAEVTYARTTDAWYSNVEGFAGGAGAAAAIVLVYRLVVARRRRPLHGPIWWSIGLGVAPPIGVQLLVGAVEGIAGIRGWDYVETLDRHRVPWLLAAVAAMSASAAVHVRMWRAVLSPRGSSE